MVSEFCSNKIRAVLPVTVTYVGDVMESSGYELLLLFCRLSNRIRVLEVLDMVTIRHMCVLSAVCFAVINSNM